MAQTHGQPVVSCYLYYSTTLADNDRYAYSWKTIANMFVLVYEFESISLTLKDGAKTTAQLTSGQC